MFDEHKIAEGLELGDRVRHPRLGTGYLLGRKQDGSVVVIFEGKSKPDVLFPYLLRKVNDGKDKERKPNSTR